MNPFIISIDGWDSLLAIKKKIIINIFWTVLLAYWIFGITGFIYFRIADQNVLTATILNFALIIFLLLIDKVETYILNKIRPKVDKKRPLLSKLLDYYGDITFKSGLYFFYIVILVYIAIIAAEPEFPIQIYSMGYFQSVEYGILILIATDNFLNQFFKDVTKK
ncbi:MAG: hypothetical protein LBE57_03540 [Methanosarcinales archaeon]|jgi:hypothetical protein|nr:hypothetical protein [Methanosarcinales archaeon]